MTYVDNNMAARVKPLTGTFLISIYEGSMINKQCKSESHWDDSLHSYSYDSNAEGP